MRTRGVRLHLQYRSGKPSWSLGDGKTVPAEVAEIITKHALVKPAGGALFPACRGKCGVRTMTETPLKVVKSEPASTPTPSDALDIEALWSGSGAGGRAHRYQLADDTRRQAEGLFPGSPGSRLPPPHRNLRPQDRGPDRDGVLHSGPEDARAVGGGPALRSRHLHLSRRLAAAVADHVSARRRKGQHGLVDRPVRGAHRDRQMGAPGLGKRSYLTRDALPGYAPDPDWRKLPPFNELVTSCVRPARRHPGHRASDLPRTDGRAGHGQRR